MRRFLFGTAIVILLGCADRAFGCSVCTYIFEYQVDGEGDWCNTCDYDVDCGVEVCNIVQVSGWDACETDGNGCFTTYRHCPSEPQAMLAPPPQQQGTQLAHVHVRRSKARRNVS